MIAEPQRRCLEPGCGRRGPWTRCPTHTHAVDRRRGSARERGMDARWDAYSRAYLARNPLCGDRDGYAATGDSVCARGRMAPNPAKVTDHVTPHRGDYALIWDPANHQALCHGCHNRKTAQKDRGRLAPGDR